MIARLGLLLLASCVAAMCSQQPSKTKEAIDRVRSEISIGMSRAEVEQRLRAMAVTYVYVPRHDLEVTRETMFEGTPLSGRFDVVTPMEPHSFYMEEAAIHIELNDREEVVNVRIEHIGGTE